MRYLPLTDEDRRAMLATVGVGRIEDLYGGVPKGALLDKPIELPSHAGEIEVERHIRGFAARNISASSAPFFLGAGNYFHHVPATVDHLIQRSEYLTSYTPYQPEISQGTLQALFEFQTQVALIAGMEIANASMYDGATSCAEAALMACRVTRRHRVVLSGGLHPHYRDVTRTNARFMSLDIVALPADACGTEDPASAIDGETACVIVQNPDVFGRVRDYSALADACHAKGALLVVVVAEVVSLGALTSPGDMGARPKASRSATPWGSADRMSACSRCAKNSYARCRGGSAARPSMQMASAAGFSRFRLASSIFGARKRPAISARIRAFARLPSASI